VYKGAIVRAFLKLTTTIYRIWTPKRIGGTHALLIFGLWLFKFMKLMSEEGDGKNENGGV
jgi:hypothetical protein